MKILDRYVAKNFLVGYAIALAVLLGLRIIIDLFVKIDEFTEHADLGTTAVLKNILTFYGLNCTLYFRDFAGMITVVAASFSFGKMVRSNELVAVMASGVSLKRVIGPIVFLAVLLTGVLVIDQELIIPHLADKLVRSHDDIPGQESYDVWFIPDGNGSLICSQRFDVETSTLEKPTILLRRPTSRPGVWAVTAWINAGIRDASAAGNSSPRSRSRADTPGALAAAGVTSSGGNAADKRSTSVDSTGAAAFAVSTSTNSCSMVNPWAPAYPRSNSSCAGIE